MRVTKQQIKTDIQHLFDELKFLGLSNTEQLAVLLRYPDSDDPAYPSGAYIRLMLSKNDKPDPSERFTDRFYGFKAWAEEQLGNGGIELVRVMDKLFIRDGYRPDANVQFITTPAKGLSFKEVIVVESTEGLIGGLVYAPADWIGQCYHDGCARFFLRRSANARYCSPECRRVETNRRRRERRTTSSI